MKANEQEGEIKKLRKKEKERLEKWKIGESTEIWEKDIEIFGKKISCFCYLSFLEKR